MKAYLILVILLNASVGLALDNPIDDPSVTPLNSIDGIGERYRMLGDFNQDGLADMALSWDTKFFGNGGGEFTLYLRSVEGRYVASGKFLAHPTSDTVAIEQWQGSSRLWTYLHGGGGVGELGYYEISDKGVGEFHHITVHPGDSGTKMGEATLEAVFRNSEVPIEVQRSTTRDGVVVWGALK